MTARLGNRLLSGNRFGLTEPAEGIGGIGPDPQAKHPAGEEQSVFGPTELPSGILVSWTAMHLR